MSQFFHRTLQGFQVFYNCHNFNLEIVTIVTYSYGMSQYFTISIVWLWVVKQGSLKIGSNVKILYKIDTKKDNCDICDWCCDNCGWSRFATIVVGVATIMFFATIMVGVATIVNIATIAITSCLSMLITGCVMITQFSTDEISVTCKAYHVLYL